MLTSSRDPIFPRLVELEPKNHCIVRLVARLLAKNILKLLSPHGAEHGAGLGVKRRQSREEAGGTKAGWDG